MTKTINFSGMQTKRKRTKNFLFTKDTEGKAYVNKETLKSD